MRHVRYRRPPGSSNPPSATGPQALDDEPRGGREPASILDAPDDFIVRRYMRWRLRSRASQPGPAELRMIQDNGEFVAVLARSSGTVVCLVLAGLSAQWLATSEQARGGASFVLASAGVVVAIGVPAACLLVRRVRRASDIGGQTAARLGWPGWFLAIDGLATVAGGIAFGYATLSEAGPAGPPAVGTVWLAPLAYVTTGVAALGVWLLPVPGASFLAHISRSVASRIRQRIVGPEVASTRPVQLREVDNGRRGPWSSGVLVLRSGSLAWLGGDRTEFDLTDTSVSTAGGSRLARAWTRAVSCVQPVRVAGPAGEFELQMTPRLYKSYLAAASDGQDAAPLRG